MHARAVPPIDSRELCIREHDHVQVRRQLSAPAFARRLPRAAVRVEELEAVNFRRDDRVQVAAVYMRRTIRDGGAIRNRMIRTCILCCILFYVLIC